LACWQLIGVHVPGVAPHTLAIALPHVWPAPQAPQSIWPPQPLPTMPQYWPLVCEHEVTEQRPESGLAPQTFGMPLPPQVNPPEQPPQSILPPQPSPTMPQYLPFGWSHFVGVQAPESSAAPHTPGVPAPPQLWPVGQLPQSILPPQPSPTTPQ
jgi:hypothetical protein